MIMSVLEVAGRKRGLDSDSGPEVKRQRPDLEADIYSEKMYSVYVKSAMDSLGKVCSDLQMFPTIARLLAERI